VVVTNAEWAGCGWADVERIRGMLPVFDRHDYVDGYPYLASLLRQLLQELEQHRADVVHIPWKPGFFTRRSHKVEKGKWNMERGPWTSSLTLELRTVDHTHATTQILSVEEENPWFHRYILERMTEEFLHHLQVCGYYEQSPGEGGDNADG
jgi:hypothetical protein